MHTAIEPFSGIWWLSSLISFLIIAGGLLYLNRMTESKRKKWEIGLFIFAMIHELLWQLFYLKSGSWDAAQSLPFHLCGISRLLGAVLLIRFQQYLYEFLILLGLAGAVQSFLTPEVTVEYNWFTHIDYYLAHGMIVFFALYQFIVKKRSIGKWAWLHAFIIGICTLSIVGIFNYYVQGNYIYLCQKPIVENPLLIGDWPYYLLCFLGFGLCNILLFHILFRWQGKKYIS